MANLNFIKKALPWIGTAVSVAIPGPIGMIAKLLTDKLGKPVAPDATKIGEAIETAVGDPQQVAALKEAELAFQQQMTAMGYQHETELEQIAAADRASARSREVQVRDWTPRTLAFIVVALCFAGEGIYFRYGAPSNASPELIGRILGTLDSALILVLSYYFGSSAGSDRKTELLANGNDH